MPTLHNIVKLNSGLAIGVQIGSGVRGTGYANKDGTYTNAGSGVWTMRAKFPKQGYKYKTTGIKYVEGDRRSLREAEDMAFEWYTELSKIHVSGGSVHKPEYLITNAKEYVDDIERSARENERYILESKNKNSTPPNDVIGGRGYWTVRRADAVCGKFRNYLFRFIESLPTSIANTPSIRLDELEDRQLDRLDEWLRRDNPTLSVETRLKFISNFRLLFCWLYHHEKIDRIPSIKRPPRGGMKTARERMRKEITPDMYRAMVVRSREKYQDSTQSQVERDYAYLFHLYMLIMANCGIRVPTGGVDHTLVRWEHLKKTTYIDRDTGEEKARWTLARPNEKGHNYEAIIMPAAYEYWNAVQRFYEQKGFDTTEGVVFVHPYSETRQLTFNETIDGIVRKTTREVVYENPRIKRGQPITSFRNRLEKLCKELGYNTSGDRNNRVPQSERISWGSFRAWFITQRLYSSEDIKIELLARACGTSINQIEIRYLRLDMAKSYDYLSAGGYDTQGKVAKYDKDTGYYIGRE